MSFGAPSERTFVALIGDLVRSKSIYQRPLVQKSLAAIIAKLNKQFRKELAANISITAGDEIQGLFRSGGVAARTIIEITDAVYPHHIRFGVGFGSASTPIDPERVWMIDGPCFHRAREGLATARERDRKRQRETPSKKGPRRLYWAVFRGFGADSDRLLTILFTLMAAIRKKRTRRQAEVIMVADLYPKRVDVAKKLRVAQSTITGILQAAFYDEAKDAEAFGIQFLEGAARAGQDSPHRNAHAPLNTMRPATRPRDDFIAVVPLPDSRDEAAKIQEELKRFRTRINEARAAISSIADRPDLNRFVLASLAAILANHARSLQETRGRLMQVLKATAREANNVEGRGVSTARTREKMLALRTEIGQSLAEIERLKRELAKAQLLRASMARG